MADTSFPQFITDRRRELELTLGDVASSIGVSPITVSNWSNGQSTPKKENLVALASVLDFPADELAEMAGVKLAADPEPVAEAESEQPVVAQEVATEVETAGTENVEPAEEPEVGIPTIEHPALAEAEVEALAVEAEVEVIEEIAAVEDSPAAVTQTPSPPSRMEPPPVPDSVPDVIPRVAVSAPTTTQLSPLTYVQDPRQLLRYRIRWGITTVALIIMAFVLVWALGELFTALSDVKESVTP